MGSEIEGAAAADLAAHEAARATHGALPLGTPCPNCDTALQGPWCHACGQKAEDYHRSILHLAEEAFEGLTHIDSRLWRTLDRLVRRPGGLTRDYLDGRRAAQIPPFRMFLVVVLIVFLAGSLGTMGPNRQTVRIAGPDSPEARKIEGRFHVEGRPAARDSALTRWVMPRLQKAAANPEPVFATMERWAHQFAVLSLLVAAPLLALAFVFQRRFMFFDHLIFAMHSLSFQGLLLAVVLALGGWVGAAAWLFLLSPIHLYFHMRGVYGTSVVGTLARMALLFAGSTIGFAMLMAGLVLIGLAGAQ